MMYQDPRIAAVAKTLRQRMTELAVRSDVLKSVELKALFDELKTLSPEQRASFGKELNSLKQELIALIKTTTQSRDTRAAIDVTAPFDINTPIQQQSKLLACSKGSQHPLTLELERVLDIFYRMGFTAVESRELDDDYHMFTSLNFPEGHPARDDYDTFVTVEKDASGKQLVAPAHTSTMQNRVLKKYRPNLEKGEPIAVVIPGRVFRNEDLDARHEHTFYQIEGIYVSKGVNVGNLIATLQSFLQEYYQKPLKVKTQPFYFPFTEPSFEFAAECIFCDQKGCSICSYSGWIELLGCGMIHPNVLRAADIDPEVYTGFAWGSGLERPIMLKYDIEDVRHFESGKLDFLRQFE